MINISICCFLSVETKFGIINVERRYRNAHGDGHFLSVMSKSVSSPHLGNSILYHFKYDISH